MLRRVFIIWLTLLSHYRRHPAQALFLLTGLSLGVAMLLATLMISSAARNSFEQAQQTIAGQAVAWIRPANGHQTLPEQLYRDLRRAGINNILPLAEGRIAVGEGFLQIRGVDLFPLLNRSSSGDNPGDLNLEQIRSALSQVDSRIESHTENQSVPQESTEQDYDLLRFSFPPFLALISDSYARARGLSDQQQLQQRNGIPLPEIRVLPDNPGLGYHILCDLRCAQQQLKMPQQLTAIMLTAIGSGEEQRIRQLISDRAELVMADKSLRNPAFTDAFLLNLQAIGLLALLVGCFIAFNAVRFSVLQRLDTVARIRLTGAAANEIGVAIFAELLCWALLASASGLILAWLLASILLPGVGITLEQLFFSNNILLLEQLHTWWLQAILIAIIATVAATLIPLLRLARQPAITSAIVTHSAGTTLWLALPLLIIGTLLASDTSDHPQWLGLLITCCWFIGGALLIPPLLKLCYQSLSRLNWLKRYPALHWLINDSRHDLQRHSLAMTAFAIAIAACIAVLTMVGSFRQAFTGYLDTTLSESLYLTPPSQQVSAIEAFLTKQPATKLVYPLYMDDATINGNPGIIRGLSNHPLRHNSFVMERFDAPDEQQLWQQLHQRRGVIINQALALSYDLQPGDQISLIVNGQSLQVNVLGIYFSYGSLVQALVIDQDWLKTLWPELQNRRLGVFLEPTTEPESVLQALNESFGLNSQHAIRPTAIKELAISIFKQTFQATQLLSVAILMIAAIGIFCACYTAQLDRRLQMTLIRILGLSAARVSALELLQLAVNMALTCLIALPLGLLVAWSSIHIVLRNSFGWYFELLVNPVQLSLLIGFSIITVLAGALIPLWLSGRRCTIDNLTGVG